MNEDSGLDWAWEDRIEPIFDIDDALDRECDSDEGEDLLEEDDFDYDCEMSGWANGYGSDGEVDSDALASAGFGTDEDYGYFGNGEEW